MLLIHFGGGRCSVRTDGGVMERGAVTLRGRPTRPPLRPGSRKGLDTCSRMLQGKHCVHERGEPNCRAHLSWLSVHRGRLACTPAPTQKAVSWGPPPGRQPARRPAPGSRCLHCWVTQPRTHTNPDLQGSSTSHIIIPWKEGK